MTDGLWKSNQKTLTNYYISLVGLAVFLLGFLVIKYKWFETLSKYKNSYALATCLFLSLWIWSYSITMISERHPVGQDKLDKDKYAQSTQNIEYGLFSLTIPCLIVVPLLMYILKGLKLVTWTFGEILYASFIACILGYSVLGSLYWIDYSIKEANRFPLESLGLDSDKNNNFYEDNKDVLWGVFGGLLGFAGMFAILLGKRVGMSDRAKNIFKWIIALLLAGALATLLLTGISYAVSNISPASNYTVYLISSTFLIFGCLIISLVPTIFKDITVPEISLAFGIIAFALALTNTIGTSTQKINNSSNFGNFTNDGTKISDYNDTSYDLLNFSMGYNYFALTLISVFICGYLFVELRGDKSQDLKKKIAKFFSFGNKYEYDYWGLALVILGIGIPLLSIALAIGQTEGWDKFKIDKEGGLPLIITGGVLSLITLIEWGFIKDSTFMLKFYHLIIIASLVFIPIISLLIYIIKTPKFFTKVQDTDNNLMIFGDTNNKNGVPLDNDSQSQFSVSSNFSYYGNGLFFSGGRTNLDLDTTRGIRYISSQSHYFNLKYLYDNNEDFREIDRGNGLNIFSLETNDIGYGQKNSTTDAYLVAVGENVGVTEGENSTIFYNTQAGTSILDIPSVDDLNNWKKADSNPFSFKGNGVTSGVSGTNNRWVAVGQNTVDFSDTVTIKYSNDGKNWTNSSGSTFTDYGNKVAFGPSGLKTNDTFIAVGRGGNNILRSTNGINWSTTTGTSLFSLEAVDVAYGMSSNGTSGIWVAVGRDDDYPIRYSADDGQTWSNADNTTYSFSKPDDVNAVSYNLNDGYFYAVGKETSGDSPVYRSNDGNTWSKYEYDFLEATSVASNLNNAKSNSKFDNIYYPYKINQQFFVDKVSSKPMTSFLVFIYLFTLALIVSTLFLMYRKSKNIN